MSLSAVKNNMYQSYSSCSILENQLSQLISMLNSVDGSTANVVSQYISGIKFPLNTVKRNFNRMLQLNKSELHIFFSEFNSKTSNIIMKLEKLSNDLDRLSKMATELYNFYKYYESMEFLLDDKVYTIVTNANELKEHIPTLNNLKNELQTFKMMIDTNNKKLRVGVRR